MDHSLLIQVGDKPHMLATVLKFVGPRLSWGDWRNVEMLNKAINKWCQSEDAATSLFGLWQERTVSLREIGKWLSTERHIGHFDLDFINPIPFLGYLDFDIDSFCVSGCLYRSIFELSDLEEKVARNAFNEGSCVRIDSLPIRGDDQWLLIDIGTIQKNEDCIPPYYFLERAVPKGLKIVLVDFVTLDSFQYAPYWRKISKAVGRAAALGLEGLIIYDRDGLFTSKVSKSFISALQEQKDREFESPLEILSFYGPSDCIGNRPSCYRMNDCQSFSSDMIYGIGSGKLRHLKYVSIGFVKLNEFLEIYLRWWNLPYTCPNLQVLELGRITVGDFPPSFQWPDNVYGPHNCCVYNLWKRGLKTNNSRLLGLWIQRVDERFVTDLAKGLFSSLRVLYTDLCYRDIPDPQQGLGRVLSIYCPVLRCLGIENDYLCADWSTDWHDLFKRLFVLIVKCEVRHPIFDTTLFPEGCELRVLTIVLYESDHNAPSWLEKLLNIIDICLPKLVHVNVYWDLEERLPLATVVLDNIKSQFRQKSVNLVFIYKSFTESIRTL